MTVVRRNSNLKSAIGSSLPVVTSLLAAISTALVAVPLTAQDPGKKLGFAAWTSEKGGVAFGSLAVVLFVAATLAMIYANATGEEDGGTAYDWSRFFWINGLSALALTLGCVALDKIWWELPALAALSCVIALIDVFNSDAHSLGRLISLSVAMGSLYIVVASQVPVYS